MKRDGTIYLTIRRKKRGGYWGNPFTVVRASTRPHRTQAGEVEIPIQIVIDDAWFALRAPLKKIEADDPPALEVQAQEAAR